ncbi:MAG: hypothetical protein CML45_02990 [Rhodobacteraceae bacterium]|nr:hypothetical protein [Paracoccaceae bacterium]|tara:strand:- start:1150 stop:3777 length:2628 start_codon:yes stop_codon:yes gene_type:complete
MIKDKHYPKLSDKIGIATKYPIIITETLGKDLGQNKRLIAGWSERRDKIVITDETKFVGLLTGRDNDLVIIDIDPPPEGDPTNACWLALIKEFPEIKNTYVEKSRREGGYHIIFKYPDKGIDYKKKTKIYTNYKGTNSDIDFLGDNAWAYSAPTQFVGEQEGCYRPHNNNEIQVMSDALFNWLLPPPPEIPVAVPVPSVPSVPIAEVSQDTQDTQAPPTQHPPNDEDWELRLVNLIGDEDWDKTETWMKIIWAIKHHGKTNSKFTIDFADKMSSRSERYGGDRARSVLDPKLKQLWAQRDTYGSFGYLVNLAKKNDAEAVNKLYRQHKYKSFDCDWDDDGMSQLDVAEYCLELLGDHIKTDKDKNLYILGGGGLWRPVDKGQLVDLNSLIQKKLLPHFKDAIKAMKDNTDLLEVRASYVAWRKKMSANTSTESLAKQIMTSLRSKADAEGIVFDPPNNSLHFKNGVLMLDKIYDMPYRHEQYFRARQPDDYATYCLPYDWREDEIKSEDVAYWTRTLNNIHNDEEDRTFLKDNIAFGLTGNPKLSQRITVNVGYKASNGKSNLYSTILKGVFNSYVLKTTGEMYNKGNDTRHKIMGKLLSHPTRIAYTEELGDKELDKDFLKDVSSGEEHTYNVLYSQNPNTRPINFVNVANSNTDINLGKDADAGIMRRISKTTWSNQFLDTNDKDEFIDVFGKVVKDTDGKALTKGTPDVGLKYGLYPRDHEMESKLKDDNTKGAFIKALFPHFIRFYKITDKTGVMELFIPDKIRVAQQEASAESDKKEEFIVEFLIKTDKDTDLILKAELLKRVNHYAREKKDFTDKDIVDAMKKHGYCYDRLKKHKGSRSCFVGVKIDEVKLKEHMAYVVMDELEEEVEC